MSVSLEIIARAVIIRAGRLLVARDIGAAWCFAAVLIGVVGGDDRVLTTRRAAPRLGASA